MRAGRKRKIGPREPSGCLSRAAQRAQSDGTKVKKPEGAPCGIYFIAPRRGGWPAKIGRANDPIKRLDHFQTAHWEELSLVKCWLVEGQRNAIRVEAEAHRRLKDAKRHMRGEWFDVTVALVDEIMGQIAKELDLLVWGRPGSAFMPSRTVGIDATKEPRYSIVRNISFR